MASGAEHTGNWLLKYWPLLSGLILLVATATAAQVQILANAVAIAENKASIQNRLPTFLYDRDQSRVLAELLDLAASVDDNEDLVSQLERATDQIDSKIELEIERLRNLISESDREQAAQLTLILQLLEQQRREALQ